MLRPTASRSAPAASSCSRYWAPPSCAACSSSCSAPTLSRSGCSACSWPSRASSARAQALRQVVVDAAALAERGLALELLRQRRLQLDLGLGVGQPFQVGGERGVAGAIGFELLHRRLDRAVELGGARHQRALLELRLLRLALEGAPLFARRGEGPLGGASGLVELGMPFLGDAELGVERLEAALAGGAARAQLADRQLEGGAFAAQLLAPLAGLLGQLRQAQQLDLLLMRRRLRRGAFLAAGRQALGSVAAFGLGANQAAFRLVEQDRLRPRLLLEVLDLLGARQQSRLLRNRAHRSSPRTG